MYCPVICPLVKLSVKAIVFAVTMPFVLVGLILQGIGMLFAGLVSLAAILMAVAATAVVFAGIAAGPFFYYKNFRWNQRHPIVVEQLEDGTLLRHRSFRPDGQTNRHQELVDVGARHLVGPRGNEIVIAAEELAAHAELQKVIANTIFESHRSTEPADEANIQAVDLAQAAGELAEANAPIADVPSVPAIPAIPRPEWIDEIVHPDLRSSRIVVKGEQCESEEACQVAYRDAVAAALCDYVRDRANICLFDMRIRRMPWHEVTVQRIAQHLRIRPSDEYLDTHDTNFEGAPLRTYLKYGLLEISPAMRDHVDGEITRWTRSFQVASYWGILMSAVAGLYLFVKVDLAGRFFGGRNRSRNSPAAVA